MRNSAVAFLALGIAFLAIGINGHKTFIYIGIVFMIIALVRWRGLTSRK
jgi:hypothetical protein